MKQIFTTAALLAASMMMTAAAVDYDAYTLNPAPGTVSNLSTLKVTFTNFSADCMLGSSVKNLSGTLVNKTNGVTYNVLAGTFDWNTYNAMTITFAEEGSSSAATITADGEYELTIAAGSFRSDNTKDEAGNWFTWTSPQITATYKIGAEETNEMSRYTFTPAEGAVASINDIRITFPDTGWDGILINDTKGIKLENTTTGEEFRVATTKGGNYMTYAGLGFTYAAATANEAITIVNPGAYKLTIPAGAFELGDYPTSGTYNADIVAYFTIEADKYNTVAQAAVTPAQGEVKSLGTIELVYGGGGGEQGPDADKVSTITLTRLGAFPTVYTCTSVRRPTNNGQYSLTFAKEGETETATIELAGDYLLQIPEGLFSAIAGENYNERMYNMAQTVFYSIAVPTGTDDLLKVELDPEAGTVTALSNVTVTFPDATNGISIPGNSVDGVKIKYKSTAGGTRTIAAIGFSSVANSKSVTLNFVSDSDAALTEAGTYTLIIPAGTFEEQGNANSKNADIEAVYTISSGQQTGIEAIDADKETFDVYGIDGVLVRRGATNADLHTLPSGLYIAGGRKIRL